MGITMHDAFPSKYIKTPDLQGRARRLKIATVQIEKVGGDDTKPVLYFIGAQKGLVLNKTKFGTLAMAFGDNSDLWIGQSVDLVPDKTLFEGKMVDSIRLAAVGIAPIQQVNAPLPQTTQNGDPHAIRNPAPVTDNLGRDPLDDEIPF